MAKCKHCNKPIILTPSAAERNRKNTEMGLPKVNYDELFQYHSECQLKMREESTKELMHRLNEDYRKRMANKIILEKSVAI